MTRGEAIKDFFYKTILPVAAAALLYCIFRSACLKNGELDYLWLWILCGLPFGIWRLRLWIIPGGGSLGSGIALFALNFILAVVVKKSRHEKYLFLICFFKSRHEEYFCRSCFFKSGHGQ